MSIENLTDKPRTTGEIATFYKVDIKTLKKWLELHKEYIGQRIGNYYTIKQLKKIIEVLDTP